MLIVTINQAQFEYDIHSLIKAFYPEEEVKVVLFEESSSFSSGNPQIAITFEETEMMITLNGTEMREQIPTAQQGNRPELKNLLKQMLYKMLSAYTKKELPWGTLTGIRPTKIPMLKLEEGKTEEEILQYMKDVYYISDKKGKLSIEIAKREKKLLSAIHYKDGYSLYIGIPFCPTTCLYCSFTSYPIAVWKKKVDEYLAALIKELDFVAESYHDKILDSVYIGGGTPTTLEVAQLDRLLEAIRRRFDFTEVKEFTVEAGRADSITGEKLRALKKHGVTRISVNPQTMKAETLKIIGRQHTVEQVIDAFHLAREEGFDNINMDLILGLPGESREDVITTIEAVKKLQPDSLTVHSLAIKRASRMNEWIEHNGIETLKNTNETMEIAARGAKDMGMEPYYLYRQKNMSGNFENVGYAAEGCYGIYNILMMEEMQSIVAIGAGSISKMVLEGGRIERADSVKDVSLYIEKIDEMIERKRRLFALE